MKKNINFYNLHLPREVRVFEVESSNIKLWNEEVIVFDVKVKDSNTILRSYSFYKEWFEINCSFDLNGNLLPEEGPIIWSFNCDISSPCFSKNNNVYNIDLEYDVLVNANGKDFIIVDEDDFEEAVKKKYLSQVEQNGALIGLKNLLNIIKNQNLATYLNDIYSFEDVVNCLEEIPMKKLDINEVNELSRNKRGLCYGEKYIK
ncbi:DUF402 domain-containing protein [Bacillus thuringiensis]|uniref:DUF402 domain-containing protein n=1 Tax=Bacillus TaxID=1386 RepID=UPI00027BFF78|nr:MULTISPECIES: DUF402 domain-containing protein [Bacillus]EJV74908.1 hypothetical protein IGE_05446 [Bacillus cereus HuB1-1]PEW78975.1 DUF402 domain-containing protein [Bacillus thuringiensis]HDX9688666.1 DUF402 domain-containing protein [Bacillus thuringiensis]